jgi:hypothetical protein
MTQVTDVPSVLRRSTDLASIQGILSGNSGSSPNPRLSTHLPEALLENALDSTALSTEAQHPEGQDQAESPLNQANTADTSRGSQGPSQQITLLNPVNPVMHENTSLGSKGEAQDIQQHLNPREGLLNNERPSDATSHRKPNTNVVSSPEEPKARKSHLSKSKTRTVGQFSHRLSEFIKNTIRHLVLIKNHRRGPSSTVTSGILPLTHQENDSRDQTMNSDVRTQEFVFNTIQDVGDSIHNADLQRGLRVPATGSSRLRSRSAPQQITPTTDNSSNPSTKDAIRRQIREEKSRQARQRELESRRCPCWPHCPCYPDGPRRPLERAHSMPPNPLIHVPGVRDTLRTDDIYREVQQISRRIQGHLPEHHSPRNIDAQSSQAESQTSTWTDSLETTLGDSTRSDQSMASNRIDQPTGRARHALLHTDFETETVRDEDENSTPRQTHPEFADTATNGAVNGFADEILQGIGDQHERQ